MPNLYVTSRRPALIVKLTASPSRHIALSGEARFARNHDLTRHHKVHEPVKQYRCTVCDRNFTRKDSLKRHLNVKKCGTTQSSGSTAKPGSSMAKGKKKAAFTLAAEDGAAPSAMSTSSVTVPKGLDDAQHSQLIPQGRNESGSRFYSSP